MPRRTNGMIGAAGPGLSRLAAALAGGGDQAYQQSYEGELGLQSKLAQAMAAARASDASAALHTEQATGVRRQNELQTPDAVRNTALLASGVPLDQGQNVDEYLRRGSIDAYDQQGQGPTMPKPAALTPQNLGALAQRIAASQSVIGGSAKGADDYFKGQDQQMHTGIGRALMDGTLTPEQRSTGLALEKASPLFHAGPDGAVMGNYTGAVDASNPIAQAGIGTKKAQANASTAAADEHRAGADEKRAKTAQTNGEGSSKQPVGSPVKGAAGFVWGPLGDDGVQTQVRVKGGPADLKAEGVLNQDTAALNGSISGFDRLATAANEVLNHPGLPGITGRMGVFPNMPGGQAANAEALLGTLKSQVGFGVLQDMRNNSKTGGALGAVSDAEGKRLEANLAALDKSQGIEQYQANLKKIITYANEAKERVRAAYSLKHGGGQQPPAAAPPAEPAAAPGAPARVTNDAEFNALPSGATFIGPDGKTRRKP